MSAEALRFMAYEGCDFAVVRALRDAGFDVVAASETMRRASDSELIERAGQEGRVFLTEDKDFGWLVFVSHAQSAGVILIRYSVSAREVLPRTVLDLVRKHGMELLGKFVVVQPGHVRIIGKPPLRL